MKRLGVPLIVFLILCVGFLAWVGATAPMLPDKVASHFDAAGKPDDWMNKGAFLTFMMLFGVGLPLFIAALIGACTFLPKSLVNLPNKDFWLSPLMVRETRLYLTGQGLWFGCLFLLMFSAQHYLTVLANRADPVRLPATAFYVVLGLFVVGVLAWTFLLIRHFKASRI